jgi:hypothetical protein
MTYLLAYVQRGTEFAVEAAINDIGGFACVPRKVDVEMVGIRRPTPEPVERPFLPNYLFCKLSPDLWHLVRNELRAPDGSRLVFSTVAWIGDGEWKRVQAFAAQVEQDYQAAMAEIEAGERRTKAQREAAARIASYKEGEAMKLLGEPLGARMGIFRRIVERDGPKIEVELQGVTMLGKPVVMTIDPTDAARAAE